MPQIDGHIRVERITLRLFPVVVSSAGQPAKHKERLVESEISQSSPALTTIGADLEKENLCRAKFARVKQGSSLESLDGRLQHWLCPPRLRNNRKQRIWIWSATTTCRAAAHISPAFISRATAGSPTSATMAAPR